MTTHIESTQQLSEALTQARDEAIEFGLPIVDPITGDLLRLLASHTSPAPSNAGPASGSSPASIPSAVVPSAIAVTPSAAVTGLYLFAGFGNNGHVTCIDSDAEHQRIARDAFRRASIAPSRFRFLPSRPLEVMGRLAHASYDLVVGDVAVQDMRAFLDAALPLLRERGLVILTGTLLDGTVTDPSRTDRDTVAAREFDAYVRDRADLTVSRFPLASGLTIIQRHPATA